MKKIILPALGFLFLLPAVLTASETDALALVVGDTINPGQTPSFLVQDMLNVHQMADKSMDSIMATGKIAIISSMALVVLIVLGFLVYRFLLVYRLNKSRYDVIETAIREGRDIPLDLLKPAKPDNRTYLNRGVIWCAVGVGVAIVLAFADLQLAVVGLLPLLVGVGLLIIYRFNRRNPAGNDEQRSSADELQ